LAPVMNLRSRYFSLLESKQRNRETSTIVVGNFTVGHGGIAKFSIV
jgi:hypothetical protein